MATYIRGGSSNFSDSLNTGFSFSGVQAAAGETIFVAYYYRNSPATASMATPTWNSETFTEIVNRGTPVGDEQSVLQVFYLTTASSGTYDIVSSNSEFVYAVGSYGVYSGVTSFTPIELENAWATATYTTPSLTISGTGLVLNILGASNWDGNYSNVASATWSAANGQTVRQSAASSVDQSGKILLADVVSSTSQTVGWTPSSNQPGYVHTAILIGDSATGPQEIRKSSTFDIESTLSGTVTAATLNGVNVFDHLTGQAGTTLSFEGAATDEITTSGEYDLVLTDDSADPDETITVQVNVVGLASFNINKDGADQGSLTDVEFIILTGAAGSRAINQQITGITTTAGGDTGTIEITDAALDVDDTITVVQQSPTVGGGLVHTATLELI